MYCNENRETLANEASSKTDLIVLKVRPRSNFSAHVLARTSGHSDALE